VRTPGVAVAALAMLGATALAADELPPSARSLTPPEREACAGEIRVLQNRRRLFAGQNLPEGELRRRNAAAEQALAECVQQFQERRRRDPDHPANPREKISPEEARQRSQERRLRLDEAHRRDPRFMREVLSAVICYQRQKKERAENGIDEENRFARLGREPDKLALYRHQSDLSRASRSLGIARKEIAEYGQPLSCDDEKIAVVAHCLAVQDGDAQRDEGCFAEEIQQYLRLLK